MSKTYTLKELAAETAATLFGDPSYEITGVNTLDEAGIGDVSFLANPKYMDAMRKSHAGVVCVGPEAARVEGKNYLVAENPSRLFQTIAELFFPPSQSGFTGIHPTAVIHATAQIGENVTVGPYAVIDANTVVGDHTVICAHVAIGHQVTIGSHCRLYPHAVVREGCRLGNRVILQPGAIVGSCGFGYTMDAMGRHQKLEQIGIVVLEDDVEIGANTTIDRSRFKVTRVKRGSKIDNLCQIAHNVEIGEDNVIAAQTGIAGSAKTGNHVMMGGQVGVLGHIAIEDRAMIATRSGVSKNLPAGTYRGSPAIPIQEYNRQEVFVRKLESLFDRLKKLETLWSKSDAPS